MKQIECVTPIRPTIQNVSGNRHHGRTGARAVIAITLCFVTVLCFCCFNYNAVEWEILMNEGLVSRLTRSKRRLLQDESGNSFQEEIRHSKPNQEIPIQQQHQRILYIVTSIAEFDTGLRQTVEGYDRFSHTMVRVIQESVASMIQAGYGVDVYLIAHYTVSNARRNELVTHLQLASLSSHDEPAEVGLEIWDDATPIGYSYENSADRVMLHTRGLSRQHRYVIKDKFMHYDLFVNFEDDMLVRGPHVDQYVRVTDALYDLRLFAASSSSSSISVSEALDSFYGPMTNQQLARTIPGFMRVEVALPDFVPPTRSKLRHNQIPVDLMWNSSSSSAIDSGTKEGGIDPSICCHVSSETATDQIPQSPGNNELYFWEMNLESMGVRRMPDENETLLPASSLVLDWVLLLGGSNNEVWSDPLYIVGDYWTGRGPQYYFGKSRERPDRRLGEYLNNQGGWMATKRQIVEWHARWCRGGFLPYVISCYG